MLREVGFWCSDEELAGEVADANRLNPLQLVDDAWFTDCHPALLKTIEWYLTRGAFVESHELAYSFCRFPDCSLALEQPQVMGACTMTDGVYCWPEGYWHYVNHHHVKPPQEFLDHLMERYGVMAEATRKAKAENKLLLWDEMEQKAVIMPQAMQEWITNYTTIQVNP
ncbi:putative mitogen-activated protein kinase kinase [Phytophthora cinnamomi]|uniref:putative mitogen-activated protein kinase kinase n=1 Tax=Phytophthora cinnamomi TaxID=4785 RepID=UPI00355A8256|nr:putative mitogen-activated protein kinase kinase [Phytophthora cinnamomi]